MPEDELEQPAAEATVDDTAGVPEADEMEAMRRLEEEIGRLAVADHVLLMMRSLSSLAVDRLGLTPGTATRKDPEQARLAIEAFRALLGVLDGKRPAQEIADHRAMLSQMQMAYVAALGPVPASDGSGDAP